MFVLLMMSPSFSARAGLESPGSRGWLRAFLRRIALRKNLDFMWTHTLRVDSKIDQSLRTSKGLLRARRVVRHGGWLDAMSSRFAVASATRMPILGSFYFQGLDRCRSGQAALGAHEVGDPVPTANSPRESWRLGDSADRRRFSQAASVVFEALFPDRLAVSTPSRVER